ncbi:MAG TPA: TnsD family Tn7-like transposition protein [Patescibacteria group bacterium]|nr:TnsD family Tn7-like transposition protein [Patescibacteria group bacterium]
MSKVWFNLFDDELLYSAIARARHYSALSMSVTQEIFFGNCKAQPQKLIPTNLWHFCNAFGYSPEYILSKHSVYNYYTPFVSKEIKDKAYNLILSANNTFNPSMALGLLETKVHKLKYCPACAMEDFKSVGVPYFHVSHNLDGIEACYKHGRMLNYISNTLDGGYRIINVEDVILSIEEPQSLHYQQIAKLAYDLINSDLASLDRECVSGKIKQLIKMQGWTRPDGTVNQIMLAEKVNEYYGVDFLNETGNRLTENHNCWVRRVSRNSGVMPKPVQYLLLINMLTSSVSTFLKIRPNTDKHQTINKKEKKSNARLLLSHKRRLLTCKRWHPEWSRRDYKINCKNAFQYVAKYDKKFIEKWMPEKINYPTKSYHRQYDVQLDKYYLDLIQQEYRRLLVEIPVVRITRYTLEKAIGKPQLLRHGNFKLCTDYVTSISESTQDVRVRKCKVIVDKYLSNGVIPTLQQIRSESKLKEYNRFGPIINDLEMYIKSSIGILELHCSKENI